VSDQFIDGFNTLVGQSRTSSYLYGHKYTQLLIHFGSGVHGFVTSLSGSTLSSLSTGFESSVFVVNSIVSNQTVLSTLDVELTPYSIGCQLYSAKKALSGAMILSDISGQKSCYTIDPSLCVLKKTECK
jgi:hypothetical protein